MLFRYKFFSARITIKNSFGILKVCFRYLKHDMFINPFMHSNKNGQTYFKDIAMFTP